MDVWEYIKLESIDLPMLYFSHQRDCVVRDGVILANSEFIKLKPGEEVVNMTIRYRTCGDMPITGAVESEADDLSKIIEEIATTRTTERGGEQMINEQKQLWKIEKNKVISRFNYKKYNIMEYQNIELLRFTTAGSVDDGKST